MSFRNHQLVILSLLIAHGCSSHSPEKSITDFWQWFGSQYEVAPSKTEPAQESITQKLRAVNKGLAAQITSTGDKQDLIITAGGNKKLFPLVKEVVEDAPAMKKWHIVAFKPKLEKLAPVEIDGIMVSPEDIFFTIQPHDGVVDVCVLLDHTIPPATAEKIAVVMLDQALGEYDAATKIGKLTFAPITELNEDNSNFRELQKAVNDYCK